MNSITSARKIIQLFACLAVSTVTAFALGVAFDAFALPLFSLSACALLVLVAVRDYAPRHVLSSGVTAKGPVVSVRGVERMPLAA